MKKLPLSISLVSLLACTFANHASAATQLNEFKLTPRVSVWGLSGNYTAGKGQALLPLSGDQSHALFAIMEGNVTGNGAWFAGAGLGYRQIVNDLLYGGYVIADHTTSRDNNGYWIANPGIEILSNTWDFNANAYIAINGKKNESTTVKWADEFGITDFVKYQGHSKYNRHASRTDFESVGQGVDFKIGRTIPGIDGAKAYVGGYYFKNKDLGKVTGGLAKITYDLSKYAALEVTDSYDNYNHNKLMLGVKLTLGGYSKQEQKEFGLSSRLMDTIDHGYTTTIVPIKKHIGNVKVENEKGEYVASDMSDLKIIESASVLQYDNKIWFFDTHLTSDGDGTYEHPFNQFTPQKLEIVKGDQPMLYVEGPTTISLAGFKGFDGLDSKLLVSDGMSIYGRINHFDKPAMENDRPLFIGGIDIRGTARNTLDSIIIHEIGSDDLARMAIVRIVGGKDVSFNKVSIGANKIKDGGYYRAFLLFDSELNLSDTSILASNISDTLGHNTDTIGIDSNISHISFVDGTNRVEAMSQVNGVATDAKGISATDSVVTFVAGRNKITASVSILGAQSGTVSAYGIELVGSEAIFSGGISAINVYSTSFTSPVDLVSYGINASSGSKVELLEQGVLGIMARNDLCPSGTGGSKVQNAYDNSADAYGIYADGSEVILNGVSNITGDNNDEHVDATLNAYGIYATELSAVSMNGNSIVHAENSSKNFESLVSLNSYGLKLDYGSKVFFAPGSRSEIMVNNTSNFFVNPHDASNAWGIVVDKSSLATFNNVGGSITIELINYSAGYLTGINAYGIQAIPGSDSHINFQNGSAVKMNIGNFYDGTNHSAYGIYTGSGDVLQIDGDSKKVSKLSDLLKYVDIKLMEGSAFPTNGYMIQGNGLAPIAWSKTAVLETSFQSQTAFAATYQKHDNLLDDDQLI